jgi:hypothetical protein
VELHDAITSGQGTYHVGYPLGAVVRDSASTRRQGHDSPSVHREPGRLVAFSDGVFAIAITLLVLEIRPPADYARLLQGFAALWPSYLAYVQCLLLAPDPRREPSCRTLTHQCGTRPLPKGRINGAEETRSGPGRR